MKAKMKKIQLMLHHGEKEQFLQKLQEKGILHLEASEKNISEETEELIGKREKIIKAKEILSSYAPEDKEIDVLDSYELADNILQKTNELEKNNSIKESLKKDIKESSLRTLSVPTHLKKPPMHRL